MANPLKGKRVVVRAPGSGVFIGTVYRMGRPNTSGLRSVTLTDAQRIWSWTGALDTATMAASGVREAKLSPVVSIAMVPDVREIFSMSDSADEKFKSIGVWRG